MGHPVYIRGYYVGVIVHKCSDVKCDWSLDGLADGAELPLLADGRGEDDVARRRVRQPQTDEVAHDVHQELQRREY